MHYFLYSYIIINIYIYIIYIYIHKCICIPPPPKKKKQKNTGKKQKQERKCLALILKNFLYFLIFGEMELFNPSSRNKKNPPQEHFLYFRKRKPQQISYIFSKESCSYILENRNTENCLIFR